MQANLAPGWASSDGFSHATILFIPNTIPDPPEHARQSLELLRRLHMAGMIL
jgi:hypothetical protein